MNFRHIAIAALCACLGAVPCIATAQQAGQKPPQQPIRASQGLGIWLVGTHPMAHDPSQQMVAHHLCQSLTPELIQCVLYDSNQPGAKLTGIEYIIPGKRFDQLPAQEKQYWHPHNFEILSGTLVGPELPDDMQLLAGNIDSYGKTFHTWMTGTMVGNPQDFPYGEPMLAWSLNKEGQLASQLKDAYKQMGFDLEAIQKARQSYTNRTQPQCGVNALDGQFTGKTASIEGVRAKEQGCPEYPFAKTKK